MSADVLDLELPIAETTQRLSTSEFDEDEATQEQSIKA